MKRMFLLLALICLPSLGIAKYCPACFQTFQVQTVRGQTKLLYRWMATVLSPENPINYANFKTLFDDEIEITNNGSRVAYGLPATYRYFVRMREQQPLLESKLQILLADGQYSAIQYQMITKRRGNKYRSLIIAVLHFKGRKLLSWTSVSYTSELLS